MAIACSLLQKQPKFYVLLYFGALVYGQCSKINKYIFFLLLLKIFIQPCHDIERKTSFRNWKWKYKSRVHFWVLVLLLLLLLLAVVAVAVAVAVAVVARGTAAPARIASLA